MSGFLPNLAYDVDSWTSSAATNFGTICSRFKFYRRSQFQFSYRKL